MFIVIPVIIVLAIYFLRAVLQEMERLDQLRLNATLSNLNASYFLLDNFDDAFQLVRVLDNITAVENRTRNEPATFEPDWKTILGKYEHYEDENFEEFLIAAGAPYFVRSIIMSAKPVVTVEKAFEGDEYYHEIEDDYLDPDYDHRTSNDDGRIYQIIITSETWIRTSVERYRLGYAFVKMDYDGTESKNLMKFLSPTVLVHYKEKKELRTNIVREFKEEGILMTIVNLETGMQARRRYRRLVYEDY